MSKGRPALPEGQQRNRTVAVTLRQEDVDALDVLRGPLTRSGYLRALLLVEVRNLTEANQ